MHADRAARALGLVPPLPLADARARCPELQVRPADPEGDAAWLARLCDWAVRYTPLVGLHLGCGESGIAEWAAPQDFALVMDITGCAHLFGGEEAMASDLARRFEAQGIAVSVGIASTIGAAFALASHAGGGRIAAGEERKALDPLPLAALRLDAATLGALARMGLKRIADIVEAPRAPLTARFGKTLLRQLARATGSEEEAFSPRLPVEPYRAEQRFFEPVVREEDVRAVCLRLNMRLAESLERAGDGALRLGLTLYRVDGAVRRIEAGLSRPSREPAMMQDILCQRLEALKDEIDAGFGYDCIVVTVTEAARRDAEALSLAGPDEAVELARFVDRVGARIGPGRITRFLAQESHLPERAVLSVPVQDLGAVFSRGESWPVPDRLPGDPPERPVRLLLRPEAVETLASVPDGPPLRFRWRRVMHEVARAEGPERIAAEWWREDAMTRDYFRVEDSEGRRFWMYRDGLYGREASHPRWFVHGLFA